MEHPTNEILFAVRPISQTLIIMTTMTHTMFKYGKFYPSPLKLLALFFFEAPSNGG